jgi:hypothetical protein
MCADEGRFASASIAVCALGEISPASQCAHLTHVAHTRAAVSPSGIEYLREVVINDKLGINVELERQMQFIVDTYQDEVRYRTFTSAALSLRCAVHLPEMYFVSCIAIVATTHLMCSHAYHLSISFVAAATALAMHTHCSGRPW